MVYRDLRYEVLDTDFEWAGLFLDIQRCKVRVRNTDDKAGTFKVKFTLDDSNKSSKESSSLIPAGEIRYISADFHVKEVEIVVLERTGLPEEIQRWLSDVRVRHPFAQMSKEEILKTLRRTRETVWAERHAR